MMLSFKDAFVHELFMVTITGLPIALFASLLEMGYLKNFMALAVLILLNLYMQRKLMDEFERTIYVIQHLSTYEIWLHLVADFAVFLATLLVCVELRSSFLPVVKFSSPVTKMFATYNASRLMIAVLRGTMWCIHRGTDSHFVNKAPSSPSATKDN